MSNGNHALKKKFDITSLLNKGHWHSQSMCFNEWVNNCQLLLPFQILSRTIRVDHCDNYKMPKEHENDDDITKEIRAKGVAPQPIMLNEEDEPTKKKSKKGVKKCNMLIAFFLYFILFIAFVLVDTSMLQLLFSSLLFRITIKICHYFKSIL